MKFHNLLRRITLFIFCLLMLIFNAATQELSEQDKETYNSGVFHFEKNDFQNGLSYFRELINKYPRDPVFNYFSGVSMTELNIDLETAVRQLQLASVGKVPVNVYFFLGKAHHIRGEYEDALSQYQKFIELGERLEIREKEVDKLIGLTKREIIPAEWKIPQGNVTGERIMADVDKERMETGAGKVSTPSGYDKLVAEAMSLQSKADSVQRLTDQKRIALRLISNEEEKSSIEKEILNLEKMSYDYQSQADVTYQEIRKVESRIAQDQTKSDRSSVLRVEQMNYRLMDEMEMAPGMMMGKQLNDEHYFESLVRDLFPGEKKSTIEDLVRINSNAVETMNSAKKIDRDINQEKLNASASKSKRENLRILNKMEAMETNALQLKHDAILQYQKVNDGLYQVFEKEISEFTSYSADEKQFEYAGMYWKQASQSYDKALKIRNEGEKTLNIEAKYDKIVEANTYELIALENQKRAYATLTGILPVPDNFTSRREIQQMMIEDQERRARKVEENRETEDQAQVIREKLMGDDSAGKDKSGDQEVSIDEAPIDPAKSVIDESRYISKEVEYGFEKKSSIPYSETNPIPLDRILPGGVIYRIQVGVYSRMVRHDYYRTLFPVTAETDLEKGFIRYYTGFFKICSEAEKALPQIRQEGYNDAFIIAHYQGKKVSLNRAKEMEEVEKSKETQEQGGLSTQAVGNPVYRIQFGIFSTPLTERSLQFYSDKVGNHRIQYLQNIDGEFIYTIGIFYTFEEAEAYKEILVSKGLKELSTIGFIGNEKISLK